MILTGAAIGQAIEDGRIVFDPFEASRLNPNSIDIHLGAEIREVESLGSADNAAVTRSETPLTSEGFILRPGALYLARSRERFGSTHFVPFVHGKSNIARAGLFVHINGEMIDLGAMDHFEFQLAPVLPIRVHSGMAIGQVSFWSVAAADNAPR